MGGEEKVEAFPNHLENVFTLNVTGSHIHRLIIDDNFQCPLNYLFPLSEQL